MPGSSVTWPGAESWPWAAGEARPSSLASLGVTAWMPGPCASLGMSSVQPGLIRLAMVSLDPSGWTRSLFSSKISRYRRPSPRWLLAISHSDSWNRPTGGLTRYILSELGAACACGTWAAVSPLTAGSRG